VNGTSREEPLDNWRPIEVPEPEVDGGNVWYAEPEVDGGNVWYAEPEPVRLTPWEAVEAAIVVGLGLGVIGLIVWGAS